MELGTKYQRNNKKFKLELLVPQGKKLIKRSVYNSFELIKETKFNNEFYYIVPIGFEFYYDKRMHINGIKIDVETLPYTPQMTFDVLKNRYKGILLKK